MADVIDTSEFRNGLKILLDNEPYVIVEFQHVKPGKGSAFVRTRYKSLISGRVLEKNFKENMDASVLFWNGRAISVDLPNAVELKVVKCDPGVRGDTVSGAMKPATLETGYTLNVPLFINEGDTLKIDTRTGEYLTRVG